MNNRWREHGQIQVVRIDPLIVLHTSTLACNSVHVFIELLMRLSRPRKEKTASGSILQTILSRALVEVELRLYDPCKTCYPKMGPGEAPPMRLLQRVVAPFP